MTIKSDAETEQRGSRIRTWVYWLSAVASTLLFVFFMATMLMVPGIMPSTKMWMLGAVGVGAAISLGVGMWRFGSTDASATLSPLGPVVGVILLLELGYCAVNVVLLATAAHL